MEFRLIKMMITLCVQIYLIMLGFMCF